MVNLCIKLNIFLYHGGHAVNDTISEDPNPTEGQPTPADSLANRMICYTAQGLSQDFHHVNIIFFNAYVPQFLAIKTCFGNLPSFYLRPLPGPGHGSLV